MDQPFRRVVTGHRSDGASIIQEDGPPARVQRVGNEHGPVFYEVWNTRETPARINAASGEPAEDGIILAPPARGTRIRVLDIPPEDGSLDNLTAEERVAHFAEIGASDAVAQSGASQRHAYMHRTETVDYGIVLDGQIVLIMDEGETTVRAGDIIVQRGTNHGWANRSDRMCRIAFVLIDGVFDQDLAGDRV